MQIRGNLLQQSEHFYSGPANWVLFFGSVFFFVSNLFASISIYPSYSLAIGGSPFLAGLQNTVFYLVAVILRFYLGPVMDKKGHKPLMLLGTFTFATTPLIVMLSPTYTLLLSARIYQAIGLAIYMPGIPTLAAEMAPMKKIGTYMGASRIFINLGLLAGPSTALFIIDNLNYNSWFVISAITSTLAMLLLSMVKTPNVKNKTKHRISIRNQLSRIITEKQIYPIIGGVALYSYINSAIVSFAAVYISSVTFETYAPYFFIVLGIAGIIGCLGAGIISDVLGRQKVAWPILALVGAGAIIFSFIPNSPVLVILCGIILGLGIQGSSLVLAAWLIDLSTSDLRNTMMSLHENTVDIVFAIGAFTFGIALQGPGLDNAFLISGILIIILTFMLSTMSSRIRAKDEK